MSRPRRDWWTERAAAALARWTRTRVSAWLRRPWRRPAWTRAYWWAALPPWSWARAAAAAAAAAGRAAGARASAVAFVLDRAWWGTWWFPPLVDPHGEPPEAVAAADWAERYLPARDDEEGLLGYGVALRYAERFYDQALKLGEALDKKLDDLMRNSGALAAIVTAAAQFAAPRWSWLLVPLAIAVCLLAAAVLLAARSRDSALMSVPMQVAGVLGLVDLEARLPRGQVEAVTAAAYHSAAVGANLVNSWKSKQLRRATALFCSGLVVLLATLATGAMVSPSARPPAGVPAPGPGA